MNNPPNNIPTSISVSSPPPPAPTLVDITNDSGPDLDVTVLNLTQLRQAIFDEGGLTQSDIDNLKMVSTVNLHGMVFETEKYIPDTQNQQYIFQIFIGAQYDDGDEYVTGDARIYVVPAQAANPREKEWRLYTFNRTVPAYTVERMTQSVFVEEVAGEWVALNDRVAERSEETTAEETTATGASF